MRAAVSGSESTPAPAELGIVVLAAGPCTARAPRGRFFTESW